MVRPERSTSWSRIGSGSCYDQKLPGDGLLVYHVDEALDANENEDHPFVKLLKPTRRGICTTARIAATRGIPIPGSSKNVALTRESNPSSKSYADIETFVTITKIGPSGAEHEGPNWRQRAAPRSSAGRKAGKAKKAKKETGEVERRAVGARLEPGNTRN